MQDFLAQYRGQFTSLLSWAALDAFWQVVRARADRGWYIYAIGEGAPIAPSDAATVAKFIDAIDALLRDEHDEDYCGIVYTDDKAAPTMVKIFDPRALGSGCGISKEPPAPGWVLSLVPPAAIDTRRVLPERRKRWWRELGMRA